MMGAGKILAGWAARRRRRAAFWPDDEVTADDYVARLRGAPRRHGPGRHRRQPPTTAMLSVGQDDLRCTLERPRTTLVSGQPAPWQQSSPAAWIDLGQVAWEARQADIARSRPAPAEPVLVTPEEAAPGDLGPYLDSLPGYGPRS
jgi:hypothetical protein